MIQSQDFDEAGSYLPSLKAATGRGICSAHAIAGRGTLSTEPAPDLGEEAAPTDSEELRCEESCGSIHLGHTRMGEREKFRMFEDLAADLPDLPIKLRGRATRKQVAELAGVRPIRLKELEEGLKHPEGLETLDKVLRVYRVRLGVAMPTR
ncbi:helix-turn-helix domain-containing protein [Kitasatospora sp. NPDC098663]|uniref:helix-turn-helix domain-containing protein n=1 Tax=Kitasatospora sp. NPDC098663 TaxID=3364096 RepID=UPI003818EFB3